MGAAGKTGFIRLRENHAGTIDLGFHFVERRRFRSGHADAVADAFWAVDGLIAAFDEFVFDERFENAADAKATLEVLLIAGVPLNEPVARYGPFVMNTEDEIRQAIKDYQLGRMGSINA